MNKYKSKGLSLIGEEGHELLSPDNDRKVIEKIIEQWWHKRGQNLVIDTIESQIYVRVQLMIEQAIEAYSLRNDHEQH